MNDRTDRTNRVEAALAGAIGLEDLNAEEGAIFNAEIAAAIERKLAESNYGVLLRERGNTAVGLDQHGRLVE